MTKPVKQIEQPFLPRYHVTHFVGEGAAARIYQVTDTRDGSVKAIKALKPQSNAEPSIVKRFEDEYQILRRLHHPSLPEVHDYGFTQDQIRYIVMELVEGVHLDQYFQSNPQDLWLLLYEICEVLSFIHDRDLLHLDLKPANVLVKQTSAYGDQKPMVVLMDFGLSYRRDAGQDRSLVGTPEYMAPEIIKGDGRLTRAADYYSLGITLYQLLAGETPFHGTINDVFQGHLRHHVKFQQEKTQYAELYPHVLGLVAKDINPRLEAFEAFRRAVAARMAGGYDELDRAYGLSVISSIGMVGKQVPWDKITEWVDGPSPVLVLTGPSGSGKSYLLDKLITQMKLTGREIFRIGSEPTIEPHVTTDRRQVIPDTPQEAGPQSTHPESQMEIFMDSWERLTSSANSRGALLVIDNYELLSPRQIEFMRYVSRRIRISQRSEDQSSIRVTIAGNAPSSGKDASDAFGDHDCFPVVLTPPTNREIDDLTKQLPGTPLTAQDRPNVTAFLKEHTDSTESTMAALESIVVNDNLRFTGDTIRFSRPAQTDKQHNVVSLSSYYASIYEILGNDESRVLEWITCHEGPIAIQELSSLTSLSDRIVSNALDTLNSYRLISHSHQYQSVALAGPRIQNELYDIIPEGRRENMHTAYVEYYDRQADLAQPESSDGYYRSLSQLLFQYHKLRGYRRLFRTYLRLLKHLKTHDAPLAAITACEMALQQLDEMSDSHGSIPSASIRRYFVKQLVNYYWVQNEFRSIRNLVHREYADSSYSVPTSIALKCCLAFVLDSRYDTPLQTAKFLKTRYHKSDSPGHLVGMLVHATALIGQSEHRKALKILDRVVLNQSRLDDYSRCRLYTSICIAYDRLNDIQQRGRYLDILESIIEADKFPHEYLTYLTARFNKHFDDYELTDAMRLTTHAIRFATMHRSYNRLVEWYFRASAVYYVRGSYARAIRYVDRSLQLVERLGLTEKVLEMEIRLAMNYQNLGQYGNAARHSNRAMILWDDKCGENVGAVIHLFHLDISLALDSPDLDAIWQRVTKYWRSVNVRRRRGYYSLLTGIYHHRNGRMTSALKAFQEARQFEETSGAIDDAVRSGIREALIYIELHKRMEAKSRIADLRNAILNVDSNDIEAELSALILAYHYFFRSPKGTIRRHLNDCETKLSQATEIPVILDIERLLFRVNASLGDTSSATRIFNRHLKRLKSIVSNIADNDVAGRFMSTSDFKLLAQEYKLLRSKSA